jgi:hypothetical protein
VQPSSRQSLFQGRTLGVLAALDLGMLVDDLPVAAVEIGFDGLALGIQAEPALAQPPGRNPL